MRLGHLVCLLLLLSPAAGADMAPEQIGRERLSTPEEGWFLVQSFGAAWIFDSHTGDMQGSLTLSELTPAVEPDLAKRQFYAAESFYSRGVRGDRTDVLTIFDADTLSATGEVEIPQKTGTLWFRNYISLLDDDRHVVVFNMTPAQSVSVVDVVDRRFVGEIATSGCALILPQPDRSFLMICGDGTLQLIRLNAGGEESARVRSDKFFDVETDPVFDRVARTGSGWILLTHSGRIFEASSDADGIRISRPWSVVPEDERKESEAGKDTAWRPGGLQPIAFHRGNHLLYLLMHQGEVDTHYQSGSEVWLVDIDRKRRIGRFPLKNTGKSVQVTQESTPRLLVLNDKGSVDVFDGQLLRPMLSIDGVGPSPLFMQTLGRND